MKKRILAGLLALCLLAGLPTAAFAAEDLESGPGTEYSEPGSPNETDETQPCTQTEGCTLEEGHEGACVLAVDGGEDGEGIQTTAVPVYPVVLANDDDEASYMSADGATNESGTFAEMLAEANQSGGTVTLLQDVTLGEGESATINGAVTLDLNGHEIKNILKATTHNYNGPYIYCDSKDVIYTIAIKSNGTLTLQDSQAGGNIKNGVSVANGGTFIMNSGSISNSEYLRGVTVAYGATFTMNGGTISNNTCVGPGNHGAGVSNGGTFIMNGGSITGNLCYGYGETYGGGVYNTGSFTLNKGEISDNSLESYTKSYTCAGGGVCIDGDNSNFEMTGGKIINNFAVDYDEDWDDYRGHGGGVFIEGAANYGKITSTFKMTGGEISGNTSALSGGGIYISNNARVDISAGSVSNNESLTSSGGGISIFNLGIAGGSWTSYSPGELHLTNVVITDNTAENYIYNEKDYGSYGGGIATCPTSATYVYLRDGGAIYGNHSENGELLAQKINSQYGNLHVLYLSAYMLGGGAYNWMDLEGSPINADQYINLGSDDFMATNSITADSNEARTANNLANVYITRNKALYMGGGIMNNGILEIGTSDASLRVEKQENGLGTASYDFTTAFWTEEDSTGAQTPYTKEITYLGSAVDGIKTVTPANGQVTFQLSKGDYIVFSGLEDGVHYKVEETSTGNYTTKYTNQEDVLEVKDEGAMTSVVVTNTYPTGTLTITKKVEGKDETEDDDPDQEFEFELELEDENGVPIKKPGLTLAATVKILSWNVVDQEVELRSADAGASSRATLTQTYDTYNTTVKFDDDGKATFTLTDGDSITITLPVGTKYKITETKAPGYTVTFEEAAEGTITSEGVTVTVINTVTDEPDPDPKPDPDPDPDPGPDPKPDPKPDPGDDDDDDDDDGPSKLNTDDHYSYIIGYKDGYVRPYGTITRGEVATIFFRLLTDEAREEYWSQESGYSDCGPDLWCNNAISTLTNMGIIDGYEDGTFRPYGKITRAQFTKIAVGFFETTKEVYKGYYTDVSKTAWYTEYVEAASRVGLVQGFEDGTFRPNAYITRAQSCVIVNRALGRKPDEDHLLPERVMVNWPDNKPGDWYYADMQEATNSHDYTWLGKGTEKKYMENWTKKLEQRDWAAFEHAWSTAHSAPGGEVVK